MLQDFSEENYGKLAFAGQNFGDNAATAPTTQGDTSGITRDVVVDYNESTGEVTVQFVETGTANGIGEGQEIGGADQGAYLAEYQSSSSSSLDFIAANPIDSDFLDEDSNEARISLDLSLIHI